MNVFEFLALEGNMQDIGPIFVALATLVGVGATLTISERRARRFSRIQREDAYRDSLRLATAKLLVRADDFRRHGSDLSNPEYVVELSEGQYDELVNLAEATSRSLNSSLVSVQIFAQDTDLIESLKRLHVSFHLASEVMHETVNAFLQMRSLHKIVEERELRWNVYSDNCEKLADISRVLLRPTVRESKRAASGG